MGFFDFLKKKEFAEIETLKKDLDAANERCKELSKFEGIADLDKEKEHIITAIKEEKDKFEQEKKQNEDTIKSLEEQIISLTKECEEKKSQIIELDDTILLQDFGMYSPVYDFANLEMYKGRCPPSGFAESLDNQAHLRRCERAAAAVVALAAHTCEQSGA